ncbi:hypothetical protein ES319_D03G000300v1, partial [Gossypium barbadense]
EIILPSLSLVSARCFCKFCILVNRYSYFSCVVYLMLVFISTKMSVMAFMSFPFTADPYNFLISFNPLLNCLFFL